MGWGEPQQPHRGRYLLRCPHCRQDVGANAKWWPTVPPHAHQDATCPGTGTRGLVRHRGRWARPLLTDTPEP